MEIIQQTYSKYKDSFDYFNLEITFENCNHLYTSGLKKKHLLLPYNDRYYFQHVGEDMITSLNTYALARDYNGAIGFKLVGCGYYGEWCSDFLYSEKCNSYSFMDELLNYETDKRKILHEHGDISSELLNSDSKVTPENFYSLTNNYVHFNFNDNKICATHRVYSARPSSTYNVCLVDFWTENITRPWTACASSHVTKISNFILNNIP